MHDYLPGGGWEGGLDLRGDGELRECSQAYPHRVPGAGEENSTKREMMPDRRFEVR